jgi:hypothetical protein
VVVVDVDVVAVMNGVVLDGENGGSGEISGGGGNGAGR